LGPNGAGKTSIISCITTLEEPTSGAVKVFGENNQKNAKFTKSQIGVVAQEVIQHGFFSVYEIMTFHSGFYGIWNNKERIEFLLNKLNLWEHRDKKVKQLSGGMKRRLMIAKSLVHTPKLLLLDEPTAGVDIELRESLWKFVVELKKSGMSILLTTHYLEEAEQLCDRVGIIHHGSLRYLGETKKIIHQLTKREVVLKMTEPQPQAKHSHLVSNTNGEIHFLIPADLELGEVLSNSNINSGHIRDIQIKEGSLEDAFLQVLGSKGENRGVEASR
ncbi:MAG: ABC transporter ATP-binding protein, partial [Pseudobdellovibrionaceae bacterium]